MFDLPRVVLIGVMASLSACTWVELEDAGAKVKVAPSGDLSMRCKSKGEIAVSVKSKVAFYERNERKVLDELETLARNEANSLGADTIQAMNQPSQGEQRFSAWLCGS